MEIRNDFVTFDLKLSIYLDTGTVAEREHLKLGTANNCFLVPEVKLSYHYCSKVSTVTASRVL
jgi:hypothetical protein